MASEKAHSCLSRLDGEVQNWRIAATDGITIALKILRAFAKSDSTVRESTIEIVC